MAKKSLKEMVEDDGEETAKRKEVLFLYINKRQQEQHY